MGLAPLGELGPHDLPATACWAPWGSLEGGHSLLPTFCLSPLGAFGPHGGELFCAPEGTRTPERRASSHLLAQEPEHCLLLCHFFLLYVRACHRTKSKAVSGNQGGGQDCHPFLSLFFFPLESPTVWLPACHQFLTVLTFGLIRKVTYIDYITEFPQKCVQNQNLKHGILRRLE